MADLNKLKQMDIEEVHRKTRITLVRLKDILEKRFDNIDPARAHGFIKILERELQLDLSEWVKEYDAYRQPNIQKDTNAAQSTENNKQTMAIKEVGQDEKPTQTIESPAKPKKQPTKTDKQQPKNMNIEINIPKQQGSYKTILIVISCFVAVLLVIIGIYLIGSTNTQEKQAVEQNNTQKQVIENEIKQTYTTATNSEDNDTKKVEVDNKTGQQESVSNNTQQNQTQKNDTQAQDSNQTQTSNNASDTQNQTQQTTLTITPKNDVWFAWVDTKTKVRGEKYTKKAPVSINIKNKTAFHFGYAVLSIEVDGEVFEYNQRGVTYMTYDKTQGIKVITQKEYRALGGR